ncbi:ECF RNA polymerase sigma factor SigK [Smaragdicoccus niigatensis]|uniref:ECF RNA polymerase sigma factor SigK n=2 Tax=Smaragdicoccus niigatensis TaxID=359359 RepID=UPI00037F76EE|nr:ECF RNA polymerase sigma factor SigK [Smaragdicoccus niigatensis]
MFNYSSPEKLMSAALQVSVLSLMSDHGPDFADGDYPEHGPSCEAPDDLRVRRREVEAKNLAALVLRCAGGDRGSFAALYDATNARIYGMVLRILRNPAFSEETMQEIYLEIWNSAGQFDPSRGSPMAWMATLAHRRAIDRVRSEQASRTRDSTYHAQSRTTDHDVVAETVADSMEAAVVVRCLETLTLKQREAINIAYYQGLSYREVADQLRTSLPTIKSRIRDGLIGLQKCLGVTR